MKRMLIFPLLAGSVLSVQAQNPIIQTKYTADPAPYVHGDTIYLYTTHDEDDAEGFKMYDWLLYTSTDMVNWQDHGAVASLKDFAWNDKENGAWAECVVERNGKWYMYCPIHGHGIGVLVSDSPYGPFKDPIGKPLVWQKEHWNDIDPSVFIDDDGQAYMYWGNPNVYCVLLNEDMISCKSDVMKLHDVPEHYQEGPWFYKRDGHYYLAYASTCCPEGIGYAMSDNALGPWKFKGYVMAPTDRTRGNHPGIIDFRGKSYGFGLNYDLKNISIKEHKERRSVGAFPLHYREDGTIVESPYFKDVVVAPANTFNPYQKVQAETMAWGYGLKTIKRGVEDIVVTDVNANEYIQLKAVDFGRKAAHTMKMNAAAVLGGQIEVRIDDKKGTLLGTLNIKSTGSEETYRTFETRLKAVEGVHDLYLVFKGKAGKSLMNLDWWQMDNEPVGHVTYSRIVENGGTGKYPAIMSEVKGLEAHTVFMPQDLSAFNENNPLPVLVWGNGACSNSPWEHYKFLNEIASQGYLVIATGYLPKNDEVYHGDMSTAQQQIESIDWALAQNKDKKSPLYHKINTKAICASGMSCGGLQTLYNGADSRISAYLICNSGLFTDASLTIPNMPMPSKDQLKKIHAPILYMLGGKEDIAYNNGMDDYHRINHVQAIAINYPVGHGGTYRQAHGGEFRFPASAWLNWQLKGDQEAAKWFTGNSPLLLQRKGWTMEKNF